MPLLKPTDERLYQKSAYVEDLPRQMHPHMPEMHQLMNAARHAVGLSAPQIGVLFRFFVYRNISLSWVVNPIIVAHSDVVVVSREGCLSWPGRFTGVPRFKTCTIRWSDENGEVIERELKLLQAMIFQHEIDHLNGKNIFPRPEAKP